MIQIVRLGLAIVVVGAIITFGIVPPVQTFLVGGVYGPGSGTAKVVAQPQLHPADVERGQTVYLSKCMGCHAPDARVAPELKGTELRVKYPRDEMIGDLIRTGRHPMPQFTGSVLSEQALLDIISYLRSKQ